MEDKKIKIYNDNLNDEELLNLVIMKTIFFQLLKMMNYINYYILT